MNRFVNETVRAYLRSARQTLCFRSNWISSLLVIFSVLFFTVAACFFIGCLFDAMAFSGLAGTETAGLPILRYILTALILGLLLSPLYAGCMLYLYDLHRSVTENGERILPSVIFSMYPSLETVTRIWSAFFLRVLFCLPIPIAMLACDAVTERLPDVVVSPYYLIIASSAAVIFLRTILLLLTVTFAARTHPLIFLAVTRPDLSLSACLRRSLTVSKKNLLQLWTLILYFIPWLLLSLCTGTVLFYVFLLPWILFTNLIFCEAILTAPTDAAAP